MRNVLQRYAAAAAALLAIGLLAVVSGCSGGKQGDGRGGQPPGPAPACEAARGKVESLYRAELTPAPGGDPAKAAKAAEIVDREIADNTEMVLWDCRRAPDKFAPCLQSAASVAQMERECVFPLDDEGAVEGALFGK